jgi:glycine/sarcosine N-methyltransferase
LFYETLARYYDEVFPAGKLTLAFLDEMFKAAGAQNILDLACGTGTYTLDLARLGYRVWGTDLEPGMIAQAREKAKAAGVDACFAVGDMREPEELGLTFDGLFCIGNSLAHLLKPADLHQALRSMCSVLAPQGRAVFQIVNFDRILMRGDTTLPLIENNHLRFTRIYRPISESRLVFDSVLEIQGENGTVDRLENSVILRPIREADLEAELQKAGFSTVHTYGDYRKSPYSPEAQATIMVADR